MIKNETQTTVADRGLSIDHNLLSSGPYVLASAIFAVVCALVGYHLLQHPQQYTELVVGSLSWIGETKSGDLAFPLLFIGSFLTAIFSLAAIGFRLQRHGHEETFRHLLLWVSLPGILWLAQSLFLTSFHGGLLYLSAGLILLLTGFAVTSLTRSTLLQTTHEFQDQLKISISIPLLGGSIALVGNLFAVYLVDPRLLMQLGIQGIETELILLILFLSFIVLGQWLFGSKNPLIHRRRLLMLGFAVQLPLPFLYFLILPLPYLGKPASSLLLFFLISLTSFSILELFQRFKQAGLEQENDLIKIISPFSLLAILLAIKLPILLDVPLISQDDWHFGEILLPWWSWKEWGMVPFVEYIPVRGLVSYLPSLLADVFFDGTATSFIAVERLQVFLLTLFGFFTIRKALGNGMAFVAMVLLPINDFTTIDIGITAALLMICEGWLRLRPTQGFLIWMGCGLVVFLFAPGQGLVLIVATSPLAAIAIYKAYKTEFKFFILAFATTLAVVALALLLTQIGAMIFGALSYIFENSAQNTTAGGIEWSRSASHIKPGISYLLFEIARTAFVLLPITILMLFPYAIQSLDRTKQRAFFTYSVPVLLITLLLIFRVTGRIDTSSFSRMGLLTIWAIVILGPIVLIKVVPRNRMPMVMVAVVFFGGLLQGKYILSALQPAPEVISLPGHRENGWRLPSHFIQVNGGEIGLPNIGNGFIQQDQIKRLKNIKSILNILLNPGETYLDLTNRSANYFYLGYKMPISYSGFYYFTTENMQIEAIKKLSNNPPPVVLVQADNITHDGGTMALRSHLLYRYILKNYHPVRIQNMVFFLHSLDRLNRLAQISGDVNAPTTLEEKLQLFDQAFLVNQLAQIPFSWGESYPSLQDALKWVADLAIHPSSYPSGENEMASQERSAPNSIRFVPNEGKSFSGQIAGLLSFDFICQQGESVNNLVVSWHHDGLEDQDKKPTDDPNQLRFSAKNGHLLVPLDAAPRWLYQDDIKYLDLFVESDCQSFSVKNAALLQRKAIYTMHE
ncbi:MAG: hypothetical protein H7832_10465 [Magnetococcus sp. DMHC-6]